jgi:GT2 family glycosyltransferase
MRMNWPLVSVVIPNYNGKKNLGELLDRCLSAVLESDYPSFEVVFVDNASTDDSVAYVKRMHERSSIALRVIPLGRNHGYAGGINAGVRRTKPASTYVFVLTTDVEIKKNLIRELVTLLERKDNGNVATVHPLVYDKSRDMFIGELHAQYPSCDPLNPWFSKYDRTGLVEVSFPAGEAFMVRKDVFANIGGFDERYYMYCEDLDLGLRLRLRGYKCVLYPDEIIVHHRSKTSGKELSYSYFQYINERNRLYTCLKVLCKRSLAALAISEASKLIGFAVLSLFSKKRKLRLSAYLHAIRQVMRDRPSLRLTRKDVQQRRVVSDHQLFSLMCGAQLRKSMIPHLENIFLTVSLPLYKIFT